MWLNHLAWKKDFKVDAILQDFHFHERDKFIKAYPQASAGSFLLVWEGATVKLSNASSAWCQGSGAMAAMAGAPSHGSGQAAAEQANFKDLVGRGRSWCLGKRATGLGPGQGQGGRTLGTHHVHCVATGSHFQQAHQLHDVPCHALAAADHYKSADPDTCVWCGFLPGIP